MRKIEDKELFWKNFLALSERTPQQRSVAAVRATHWDTCAVGEVGLAKVWSDNLEVAALGAEFTDLASGTALHDYFPEDLLRMQDIYKRLKQIADEEVYKG